MKLVILESPYAGYITLNTRYARICLQHSLSLGEAPFASHLLYTQVLDDTIPDLRAKGISAGFEWSKRADLTAVYDDLGVTPGMSKGIASALTAKRPLEYRSLRDHKSFGPDVRRLIRASEKP